MAYRTFVDSNGVEWQSWDVVPKGAERRISERRVHFESVSFADRRRANRRTVQGRWTLLTSRLRDGWLCFESLQGRRRLTPIPADWEDCSARVLESYCRSASPVKLSSPLSRRA